MKGKSVYVTEAVRAFLELRGAAKRLTLVDLASRGQSTPTPLPAGATMAERRMIAMLPDEAGIYLARLAREAAPPPSSAELAFIELLLGWHKE